MSHHSFNDSLAFSRLASSWGGWEHLYRRFFLGFHSMQEFAQDGWHQRAGIDRSVTLADSNRYLIDEKARGRNKKTGNVYSDIALEYLSNDRTRAPGWVCKPLSCHYIAYAILPLGVAYLLPVPQLQAAWQLFGERWRQEYGVRYSQNASYRTWFCPVPSDVLLNAIAGMMQKCFTKFECIQD